MAGIAIVVIIVCLVALYALVKFMIKTAAALFLHALGGLVVFVAVNYYFKLLIPYDALTLLVCIAGGVPGAVCIIILDLIGVTI